MGVLRHVPFLIAANDSPREWKAASRRVCGGANDHFIIQEAYDAGAGIVTLAPGNFVLGGTIKMPNQGVLQGSNMGKTQMTLSNHTYRDCIRWDTEVPDVYAGNFGTVRWMNVNGNRLGQCLAYGTVSAWGAGGIGRYLRDSAKTWTDDQWNGYLIEFYDGASAGQWSVIGDTLAANSEIQSVAWGGATDPNATTKYRIIHGCKLASATVNTFTDAAGATKTLAANALADTMVEVIAGTGANQTRWVSSHTADGVYTISKDWSTTPDSTSVIVFKFNGMSVRGTGGLDHICRDVFFDQCAGDGVYNERPWGALYQGIFEYCSFDGIHIEDNPTAFAANTPDEGPKVVNSKAVWNTRHGVNLGELVYDTLITNSELGATGILSAGVRVRDANGVAISNSRFVSFANGAYAGVHITGTAGRCYNVNINGCTFRAAPATGPLYGIYTQGGTGHQVRDNHFSGFDWSAGKLPWRDLNGRTSYSGNKVLDGNSGATADASHYNDTYRATVTAQKAAGGNYIIVTPRCGTIPSSCTLNVQFAPANAAAGSHDAEWYATVETTGEGSTTTPVVLLHWVDIQAGVDYSFHVQVTITDRDKD